MKFLHIGDLHLGKRLNNYDLLPDQKYVLEQIIDILKTEECDAVLLAGDVYDRSNPPVEALMLFDTFVTEISGLNKKIYIIGGNHDSSERIGYLSSLIRNAGIYTSEQYNGKISCFTLNDDYGPINIYLLPFIRLINIKKYFLDKEINNYDDALKCVIEKETIDTNARNIIVSHQFITGAKASDEEMSVGGIDNVSAAVYDEFDYVALGHLHGAQQICRETMRYCGSPLKYSFSEENQKKCVTIVDVKEKGKIDLKLVLINFLHDMHTITGTYSELMQPEKYSEDFVRIVLTDKEILPDARENLRMIFPNMMKFEAMSVETDIDFDERLDFENDKGVMEHFRNFYNDMCGEDPTEEQIKIISDIVEEIKAEKDS